MKKSKKKAKAKPKAFKKPVSKSNTKNNKLGQPYGDRILLKPLSPEEMGQTTSFGIIIPDTAKEKPEQGVVIAIGPGKKNDEGRVIPLNIKVGDRVMFSKYGYDEVKVGGTEYYLIAESSILMVFSK